MNPGAAWRLEERDGLRLVRCAPLARVPGVAHAFSTRRGEGGDGFDLGSHDDARAEVHARRGALLEACGLGGGRPTRLHQVHGAELIEAGDAGLGAPGPCADGVLATARGSGDWVPAVRWADCVPVLLASEDGEAVAAVHSGWRGTAAGIVPRAVERLAVTGRAPRSLVAAVGPAIGPCCYEVGAEPAAAVERASGTAAERRAGPCGDRLVLDLPAAVRAQLERAGLPRSSIHIAPWCTACAADLFFSHRREGAAAGRQMACIGWARPTLP